MMNVGFFILDFRNSQPATQNDERQMGTSNIELSTSNFEHFDFVER
ncbi:MAG: hypothetical protein RL117_1268 [Verrucomicrobiota bacterium]|jgi:hypothetical protein